MLARLLPSPHSPWCPPASAVAAAQQCQWLRARWGQPAAAVHQPAVRVSGAGPSAAASPRPGHGGQSGRESSKLSTHRAPEVAGCSKMLHFFFFPPLGCWFHARHLPALFFKCSHSVPSHLCPGHLQHCHWGSSHGPDCGCAGRSRVIPPTLPRFEAPEASNLEGKYPTVC